ncbi:fimbrial protein [Chelativorans salis]|uniref:Fimbrial protein n=1 Tax=Chelativorans salis TaxID=2978478 RepID=A0ABT2LRZ6_9HYPH|nr:fimbrial protein [Chelativorans sp. EGI FJ00035]MCT7377300.1 fimbrial protein [Chelativorans sp. EGI FJ00035]
MAGPAPNQNDEDKPLDPAAERVRRKLVRFMGINLAILFAAVMAVVLALVYRSMTPQPDDAALTQAPASGEALSGDIRLPAGSRIVSHAISSNRLTLHLRLAEGGEAIVVYDMAEGRTVGRLEIGYETP